MPRTVKAKPAAVKTAAKVIKKPSAVKKKSKLYAMPEPIPVGTVLKDLSKTQWMIGPSIGVGGFGEIYSACKLGEKNYDYVVKCEPHGNGPLFVEMHFYMRNARLEDIEHFKDEHGVKALGMPYMIGNGSHDINGQKHRFIVMPRYGTDVASFFVKNGRRLPEATIYRLALQMIDVFAYVHSCGYVHADLKGSNIVLGYGKEGASQAYLVDYGLASHFTTKDFKPDPKKMHNGTIEYTSRDAHQGVATMRSDLEILGYNLIEWSGVQLPWVRDKLLAAPAKVQQAKIDFMADVDGSLKAIFPNGQVPAPISAFFKYLSTLEFNDTPDYGACHKIFAGALKIMKCANTGDLDFQFKSNTNLRGASSPVAGGSKQKAKPTKVAAAKVNVADSTDDDDDIEICASDDDQHDVIFTDKPRGRNATRTTARTLKTITKAAAHTNKHKEKNTITTPSPSKKRTANAKSSPGGKDIATSPKKSPSKRGQSKDTIKRTHSPKDGGHNKQNSKTNASAKPHTSSDKSSSSAVSVSTPTTSTGKTIINDSMKSSSKPGKTYEFNFELDVSMDANVVVNVKRKKKPKDATNANTGTPTAGNGSSPAPPTGESASDEPPVTRAKVRKLYTAEGPNKCSMRTPSVTFVKRPR